MDSTTPRDPERDYPPLWDSSGLDVAILSAALLILDLVAMGLRFWARKLTGKKLVFNDYAAIVALVLSAGLCSILISMPFYAGGGHHVYDIPYSKRNGIHLLFTVAQPFWGGANTSVKLSLLHLFITIFPSQRFRWVCYGVMVLVAAYLIPVLVATFVLCTPVQYNWNRTIEGGKCANQILMFTIAAVFNLVTDLIIVIMPIPMLWGLRVPLAKKLGIIAIFSLGAVICVISLLRTIYVPTIDLADFHYSAATFGRWSVLEPTLGVINACLPVMRPVLVRFVRTTRGCWPKVLLACSRTDSSQADLQEPSGSSKRESEGSTKASKDKGAKGGALPTVDRLYPLETIEVTSTIRRESKAWTGSPIESPHNAVIEGGDRSLVTRKCEII
ncbi:hypothetical protein BDY21DRAFT_350155 [Lineolata rhizophorae]|uniref:Rhodopsin domain-containing protein n=1 Tax=Lineolata rhizophorae TaxID=578093 RepID=A0A6A6NVG9_9PEZI|nr:hypothetical protein BDY21DRAFT_350155 [Lineolata rhizophorae]